MRPDQRRTGQDESLRTPFDPLTTVRLPPPSTNTAYSWSNSNFQILRQPLNDNTNMLRTPESIMRLHDNTLKRTADPASVSKRSKLSASAPDSATSYYSPSSSFVPDNIGDSDISSWGNAFIQRGGHAGYEHGRAVERPNTAHPGTYPTYYSQHQHSDARHSAQDNSMLSPSATPYDRKASSEMVSSAQTPTRGDRPMFISNNNDGSGFSGDFLKDRTGSGMMMMPPLPSSASAVAAAAAAAAATPQSHLYGAHLVNTEMDIPNVSGRQGPQMAKHIEIPPPDQMPKIEDDGKKPTYSYATLIGMAILRAPERRLTLSQIYSWIMDTFEFYRNSKPTWHNSIRHNLSLNKAFEKKVRPKGDPGKGNYWTIVEGLEHQFVRPRAPKRGSESMIHDTPALSRDSSSADRSSHAARMSSETKPAGLQYSSASRIHRTEQHKQQLVNSRNHETNIPSDGTEPDECMLEEEKHVHDSTGYPHHNSSQDVNAQARQSFSYENDPAMNSHLFSVTGSPSKLPRMHAMSSSSSSRPHSPNISVPSLTPALPQQPSPSTEFRPDQRHNISLNRISSSGFGNNANEWRGQGQFAFRCSTPSMILSSANSSTEAPFSATAAQECFLQPGMYFQPSESSQMSPLKHTDSPGSAAALSDNNRSQSDSSGINIDPTGEPNASSVDKRTSSTAKTGGLHRETIANNIVTISREGEAKNASTAHINISDPKTPEKTATSTIDSALSSGSSSGSNILHGLQTLLAPPRSLESPYAGTLDLSPGLLMDGSDKSQLRQQRHRKKTSSLNHLADFLELDFCKTEQGTPAHRRTASSGSDESASSDSGHHTSSGRNTSGSNAPANGPLSHTNSFSMTFDLDLSPRVVVTPIRRPFDTPIRDQSHAYSPYCRGASSSFGSPLRKN